jgi:hypothetical protein
MKRIRKNKDELKSDHPASRKRRLQARLRELNARGEQELSAIMNSIEQAKNTFRSKKP